MSQCRVRARCHLSSARTPRPLRCEMKRTTRGELRHIAAQSPAEEVLCSVCLTISNKEPSTRPTQAPHGIEHHRLTLAGTYRPLVLMYGKHRAYAACQPPTLSVSVVLKHAEHMVRGAELLLSGHRAHKFTPDELNGVYLLYSFCCLKTYRHNQLPIRSNSSSTPPSHRYCKQASIAKCLNTYAFALSVLPPVQPQPIKLFNDIPSHLSRLLRHLGHFFTASPFKLQQQHPLTPQPSSSTHPQHTPHPPHQQSQSTNPSATSAHRKHFPSSQH